MPADNVYATGLMVQDDIKYKVKGNDATNVVVVSPDVGGVVRV